MSGMGSVGVESPFHEGRWSRLATISQFVNSLVFAATSPEHRRLGFGNCFGGGSRPQPRDQFVPAP
jgi:hypothetical protein